MKKIFIILISALIFNSSKAQHDFTTKKDDLFLKQEPSKTLPNILRYLSWNAGYEFSTPLGSMNQGMSNVHGIAIGGGIPLNFVTNSLVLNANLNYGLYGMKTFGINYRQNGNYINTSITYNSDVTQTGLGLQYVFNQNKKIQPYLAVKSGVTFFSSSFSVNDPNDIDACRSLESESIINDQTYYFGYGAGLRFLVGDKSARNRSFINFSIEQIRGGNINYINVNSLHDHNAPPTTTTGAKPINISFVNANSQNVHQHRVAEQFTNQLNMIQLKLSYTHMIRK